MKKSINIAGTAKKSAERTAKVVAMATAMCATMHLDAKQTAGAQQAFQDMCDEYGPQCIIIDMNPFGGLIA